jgi:pentatricopeptide repeat protein
VNFIILLERAELHKATSKLGKYKKAVELLQQMPQAGLSPKTFTVVLVLNACADHKQLKRAGISTNRIIKHIWESEVQWHVASSPRNMRNAEPARIA